jgi:hypothetical protein
LEEVRGWYSRGYRTADLGLEEVGIAEVTEQLTWGWKRWHSRGYRTSDLGLEEVGIAEVTEQLT